jgi:hypothetical protein
MPNIKTKCLSLCICFIGVTSCASNVPKESPVGKVSGSETESYNGSQSTVFNAVDGDLGMSDPPSPVVGGQPLPEINLIPDDELPIEEIDCDNAEDLCETGIFDCDDIADYCDYGPDDGQDLPDEFDWDK